MALPTPYDGALVCWSQSSGGLTAGTELMLNGEQLESPLLSTPFITPPTSGVYLIKTYVRVTQAASTSSTLGPITVSYTDADTGVVTDLILDLETADWGHTAQSGIVSASNAASVSVTYAVPFTGTSAPSVMLSYIGTAAPSGHASLWAIEPVGSSGNWTGFTAHFGGPVTANYYYHAGGYGAGLNIFDQSNTLLSGLQGPVLVSAAQGQPIGISIGYQSAGATPMQYAYHIRAFLINEF